MKLNFLVEGQFDNLHRRVGLPLNRLGSNQRLVALHQRWTKIQIVWARIHDGRSSISNTSKRKQFFIIEVRDWLYRQPISVLGRVFDDGGGSSGIARHARDDRVRSTFVEQQVSGDRLFGFRRIGLSAPVAQNGHSGGESRIVVVWWSARFHDWSRYIRR